MLSTGQTCGARYSLARELLFVSHSFHLCMTCLEVGVYAIKKNTYIASTVITKASLSFHSSRNSRGCCTTVLLPPQRHRALWWCEQGVADWLTAALQLFARAKFSHVGEPDSRGPGGCNPRCTTDHPCSKAPLLQHTMLPFACSEATTPPWIFSRWLFYRVAA
jgi:hypothetical protein